MTAFTERAEITRRMREHLVPLTEAWQTDNPDRLMARGHLCQRLADTLSVRRQSMSRYIGEAVAEGRLLEIHPLPDWSLTLPDGLDLPKLYARPERARPHLYEAQALKPTSRGAGNASFIITPTGLSELLPLVRTAIGWPEPADAAYYAPAIDRRIRPEMYRDLHEALVKKSPHHLRASQAHGILEELLGILHLKQ